MYSIIESGVLRAEQTALTTPGQLRSARTARNATHLTVGAASLSHLRRALPLLHRYGSTNRLTVAVLSTDRPGLISIPPVLTGTVIEESTIKVRDGGSNGMVVTLTLNRRTSVHGLVAALFSSPPAGGRGLPAHGLRIGLSDARTTAWAAADAWARPASARSLKVPLGDIPPVDVVVGPDVRQDVDEPGAPALIDPTVDRTGWDWAAIASSAELKEFTSRTKDPARVTPPWIAASSLLPPVDVATISPRGFVNTPTLGEASAHCRPGSRTWDVRLSQHKSLRLLDIEQGIGEDAIAELRQLRSIAIDTSDASGPVDLANLLATLCVAGVPMRLAGPLPAVTTQLLGPLADALTGTGTKDFDDDLEREAWSVRTRRRALLRFSPSAQWGAIGSHVSRTTPTSSVSVILATRRPGNLAFALRQIERQTWPETEVNVVLHGVPRSHPDVVRAVERYRRPIQLIEVDGSVVFGEALNAGLDACSGRYVAKMDDDDWYGPDHLTDLVLAHQYSGANLVGLADHYVYLAEDDVTIRDIAHGTEKPAKRVSGGTLALAREDMLAAGGWRPVYRAVDRCLMQAIRALGGTLYAMHDLGFCLYRGPGELHTWDPGSTHFLARDPHMWEGFVPPPELTSIDHPALGHT